MAQDHATIDIPNAKIGVNTKLCGESGPYNNPGERNFNVIHEEDAFEQALSYGMKGLCRHISTTTNIYGSCF